MKPIGIKRGRPERACNVGSRVHGPPIGPVEARAICPLQPGHVARNVCACGPDDDLVFGEPDVHEPDKIARRTRRGAPTRARRPGPHHDSARPAPGGRRALGSPPPPCTVSITESVQFQSPLTHAVADLEAGDVPSVTQGAVDRSMNVFATGVRGSKPCPRSDAGVDGVDRAVVIKRMSTSRSCSTTEVAPSRGEL